MNAYTQSAIDSLKHLHSIKAGTPEFVRGGAAADVVLARAVRWLERRDYNEGDFGGPAAVAMHVAMNCATGEYGLR